MRNSKQETIADIVAALRAVAYIQTAESPRDVLEFANRIEAAAKREREAGAEAAQVCGEIGEMIGREATREKSSRVDLNFLRWEYAQDCPVSRDKLADAIDIGVSALAAPPRNCDMYTTLDDARNAFFADYVSDETCSSATAFAIWLYDEAKGVTYGSK